MKRYLRRIIWILGSGRTHLRFSEYSVKPIEGDDRMLTMCKVAECPDDDDILCVWTRQGDRGKYDEL